MEWKYQSVYRLMDHLHWLFHQTPIAHEISGWAVVHASLETLDLTASSRFGHLEIISCIDSLLQRILGRVHHD